MIEQMFSSHPMSTERYQTAKNASDTTYASQKNLPLGRERYMDKTANLRKQKFAITAMQDGLGAMSQEKYGEAEEHFKRALKAEPGDYAGLVMMAHLHIIMDRAQSAEGFAEKAKRVYPGEAQCHNLSGIAKLMQKKYAAAFDAFDRYEKLLPGDPNPIFLKGFSQENMAHKPQAAEEYMRYLKMVNQGEQAEHARTRLIEWGYIEQQPAQTETTQ